MTRIIAGSARGRRLQVPPGPGTRPTASLVREAVFSRLEHDGAVDGHRVLDLFAGSGALGLEAASRGAQAVVCVESAHAVARLIGTNAASLGLAAQVTVVARPVAAFLGATAAAPFDLVLADPPYAMADDELAGVLAALVNNAWLSEDAVVVVERDARSAEPRWPGGLDPYTQRRYGQTRVWYGQLAGGGAA
ncbi:MAG: 16S rRNA (guanine(966)-N(2))-methyltransferase RsmD [Micrococcales bacterium]|nr:MAG: 16S rRNA (guanine(966)-N(2))-methyltransferase RsmD [Micrococcales bacterium]